MASSSSIPQYQTSDALESSSPGLTKNPNVTHVSATLNATSSKTTTRSALRLPRNPLAGHVVPATHLPQVEFVPSEVPTTVKYISANKSSSARNLFLIDYLKERNISKANKVDFDQAWNILAASERSVYIQSSGTKKTNLQSKRKGKQRENIKTIVQLNPTEPRRNAHVRFPLGLSSSLARVWQQTWNQTDLSWRRGTTPPDESLYRRNVGPNVAAASYLFNWTQLVDYARLHPLGVSEANPSLSLSLTTKFEVHLIQHAASDQGWSTKVNWANFVI
ncbi:hypothetical protein EV360DRAFT_78939 [Lentinula raphanica]|nr:hypothetical protein EV360DRAFT_78939 [Lentinula raphanica]